MATQQNASFFSIPIFHSSSEFRVNTAHFSKEDLSHFIEYLETIEYLKRKLNERQYQYEEQILEARLILEHSLHISTEPSNTGCMPSPTSSLNEELQDLCEKPESPTDHQKPQPNQTILMRKSSDEEETYFSDANTSPNRTRVSLVKKRRSLFATSPKPTKGTTPSSDSEESGISPLICTPEQKPSRPLKHTQSHKPKPSAGSRILAVLLRREILRDHEKKRPKNTIRVKKSASHLNVSKGHEQNDFHEFIKQKYKRFALRYIHKQKKHVVVEEEQDQPDEIQMLGNAFRNMTL